MDGNACLYRVASSSIPKLLHFIVDVTQSEGGSC